MLRLKTIPDLDLSQLQAFRNASPQPLSKNSRSEFNSVVLGLGIDAPVHIPTGEANTQNVLIVRDFEDPLLELQRLLREASEIEHSLMVQYLFAADTLKPAYRHVAGTPRNSHKVLRGVAVQEMQHLATVCGFTAALGGRPNIRRQDLPFEPDIYPFEMRLERLTQYSAAKYLYTEAPSTKLNPSSPDSESEEFLDKLNNVLAEGKGGAPRPNHLGSLYSTILMLMEETAQAHPNLINLIASWRQRIADVQDEGEDYHYELFKSVFQGTHQGFNDVENVWEFDPDDPKYPSVAISAGKSAYSGLENSIEDRETRRIAWLANLNYWIILILLQNYYTHRHVEFIESAKSHMVKPLITLNIKLVERGAGAPYDQLSMDYQMGQDLKTSLNQLDLLLDEAIHYQTSLAAQLGNFSTETVFETKNSIRRLLTA